MLENTILILLSAALGGGGSAAILQTIRWWYERKNPVNKGLVDVAKIYDLLVTCRASISASRIELLKLHNGGGRPQAGSPMFSTSIYEVYADNQPPNSINWQRERIDTDQQYRKMLLDMFDQDNVRVHTEKMSPGKLKDTYLFFSVNRSLIKSIGQKDNEFYYLSITFCDNNPKIDLENYMVRVCASKIRAILGCNT